MSAQLIYLIVWINPQILFPQDIALAKSLFAHANVPDVASKHGADILFGGHDHMYYIGKGIDSYDNYEPPSDDPGAEDDDGVR